MVWFVVTTERPFLGVTSIVNIWTLIINFINRYMLSSSLWRKLKRNTISLLEKTLYTQSLICMAIVRKRTSSSTVLTTKFTRITILRCALSLSYSLNTPTCSATSHASLDLSPPKWRPPELFSLRNSASWTASPLKPLSTATYLKIESTRSSILRCIRALEEN